MTAIHEHELGLTWTMEEAMERSSHALADDRERVWLVDPVDDEEAMERVAALGEPAGVLQLLDRHNRDNEAIARRLGVPHIRLPRALGDAPFAPQPVLGLPLWREVALWWPAKRALVVAEALGTGRAFAVGDGPVGVHPMLRLFPPRSLKKFDIEHLLVGHGPPEHGDQAAAHVKEALDRSLLDLPKLVVKLPSLLRNIG